MPDTGTRMACGFNDHVHISPRTKCLATVDETGGRNAMLVPADIRAGRPRPVRVEIRNGRDNQARRRRHL